MFVAVPLVCFIFMFLIIYMSSWKSCATVSLRHSFLVSSIAYGVMITIFVESLSFFNLIIFNWVLALWGISCFALAFISCVLIFRIRPKISFKAIKISFFEKFCYLAVIFIIFVIAIIAFLSPPNSWDTMVYHMSRVMHWIQNHNVSFYPTHILRQLHQNPWAEFAIMNLQVLSGGDIFANIVQWFSMFGSMIGVSLVAKQLGAGRKGQIFSAVIAASIPEGILQASSTQNDYVASFWLVCFVYFIMLLKNRPTLAHSLAAGAGLGLAVLTKSTNYVYAFPFLLWLFIPGFKNPGNGLLWKKVFMILAVALILNLGHYYRNLSLYGSPLGPCRESESYTYVNDLFTVNSITSNLIRNISLHIGTPIKKINHLSEKAVMLAHKFLAIDVNDPRTTWHLSKFNINGPSLYEGDAGNPLHLAIIILCVIISFKTRYKVRPIIAGYAGALLSAFVLFCLFLKWQPWHSRLHLPIFVLWSPFMGLVLSENVNERVLKAIIIAFIVFSIPWLFANGLRPFFGNKSVFSVKRIDRYFVNRPSIKNKYLKAAEKIKFGVGRNVGLYLGIDDWEYPFWVLLKSGEGPPIRIEHIDVTNASSAMYKKYPFNAFVPSDVIYVHRESGRLCVECFSYQKYLSMRTGDKMHE
ncbi:MAG: hypothetical protein A2Z72_02835 [Omnitrophica bacterium RBG_13_46_9]|nr:MAG: hypothetical protein A2Z72_02835 [Omnitrophica bacterium RBG_13_46_9]